MPMALESRQALARKRRIIRGAMQYIVFTADVQAAQVAKLRDAMTRASNAREDIYLLLSSGGGNVFEGLSMGAFLKALPVAVTTHNLGQIDSIANLIFSAGARRYANPAASFMFHGVSMHYERQDFIESQLEEQYRGVKRMREDITTAIAAYSGLSVTDVNTLMVSGTTILTAREALSKGIIHEIRDATIPPGSQIVAIGNA
jgi:ATP-dependent Clp protease, protease subunit